MNIMLAHKFFFRGGGTATYLFNLMQVLEERGHRPIPFSVAYRRAEPTPYQEYFVSPPGDPDQVFYRELTKTPATVLRLLARATFSLETYRKARQLIRAAEVDLVYVNNIYNYMSPSVISAGKAEGRPVVMRVSDYNLVCAAYSLYRGGGRACTECLPRGWTPALRHRCVKGSLPATAVRVFAMRVHHLLRLYRQVDLFVTPSEFMRRTLISAGYPETKTVHLPSFVPPNGDGAAPGAGDHILYFGRVSPEKGLEVLIRAYTGLRQAPPLLIAGEGRDGERERLQGLATRAGGARVQFLGHQSPEALSRLIARACFTVVPSLQHDNCPMSVLESFAHGKPVIGSRLGGIPEQLAQGCGLLFEAGDIGELQLRMQHLLDRPELCSEMGERARSRVRTDFSKERHCDRLLDLFSSLSRHRSLTAKGAPRL